MSNLSTLQYRYVYPPRTVSIVYSKMKHDYTKSEHILELSLRLAVDPAWLCDNVQDVENIIKST